MTDIIENFFYTCESAKGFNPLSSESTPSFTKKTDLKHSDIELDYINDDEFGMFFEDNMERRFGSVMRNCYVRQNDKRRIQYWDNSKLDGGSMCQYLATGNLFEYEVTEEKVCKL